MTTERYARMQEVYAVFLTETPTIETIIMYEKEQSDELQSFCADNLRPGIKWSTGIGVIDAVQAIMDAAVENGNIDTGGKICPDLHMTY